MTPKNVMEPAPGVELSGSVQLVSKLGEGGMGSVWTAQHLALRTQVAVKFLAAHMAQDASAAARFQREATAAARIKSPHVVQIFDHGVSADFGPYIVMELLEGDSLASFVQRHARLTPAYTTQVMTQLCRALGKAHAQGIVHRDIKPDNVFLIDAEREVFVKVLDFGIAKSASDLSVTSTGAMMGTPHYMSPEQMLSTKHVDLRADLWASAVLAYHCLTGGVPFDGETFGAVAIAVTQGEFPPPHARYGVGSPALDAWFARALARDVNARFQTSDELAESFAQAAGAWQGRANATGSGIAASGVSFDSLTARPAPTFTGVANTNGVPTVMVGPKAPKALLAAVGVVFTGTLVAGGLLLFRGHDAPTPPSAGTLTSAGTLPSVTATEPKPAAPSAAESVTAAPPIVSAPPVVSAPPAASAPPVAPPTPIATHKPRVVKPPTPPTSNKPDRGF